VRIAAATFNRPAEMIGDNMLVAPPPAFASFTIQRTFSDRTHLRVGSGGPGGQYVAAKLKGLGQG
jgi:hypothetical protein